MTQALTTTARALPFEQEIQRDPRLKSAHTRRAYTAALARFEGWRDGRLMTVTLVEEYLAHLQRDGLGAASVNHALAVIRWWARRIAKLAADYADPETVKRIEDLAARVVTVGDIKGTSAPTGRHLDDPEIIALIAACNRDPSPAGARDAALIAVAWSTGARIHEIQGLELSHVSYTQEGADLLIHGKGDKPRAAYLFNGALDALNRWLDLRGVAPGPVFNPVSKNHNVGTGRPIGLEGLRKILKRRVMEAGITKHMTWHDFRRTFIGKLFDNGVDIATAQDLAGHADPTTTTRYDRRPDRRKREAVQIVTAVTLEIPKG